MDKPQKIELEDDELIEEMEKLEDAVRASVVPPSRQVLRGFLTGIASGMGAIVAAVVIIPLLVYFLRNIEWVPLVGNFVDRVTEYMERGK